MALTVLVAKVIGCVLPMLAKKVGFDPAVMASPFITTIVDALSLLIYFGMRAPAAELKNTIPDAAAFGMFLWLIGGAPTADLYRLSLK